ncbi:spore germination protein [Paenibacillus doosanensis]|uniref:Spore germination protein B1 n=1 Tax=Paenibacillus konkukensis TaxID=2020716 RepID=A0ABY4RF83_9BACL|nr:MULTISPECIES: spore germination protein [Paenibacillus]MCS7460537.1 spore germination protein [Paenibacillus doosanensis]UQZ81241.1 Spore germination protein B1 [Paenibacillus konkukensis]
MLDEVKRQLGNPADLTAQLLNNGYTQMEFCFFASMSDINQVKDAVVVPFSYRFDPREFKRMLEGSPAFVKADDSQEWVAMLLRGCTLIEYEGVVYAMQAIRKMQTQPENTEVEASLQGPQSAFTEDLDMNTNLVRLRYNLPTLTVEKMEKGDSSKTRFMILYDRDKVDRKPLEELHQRLDKVQIKLLQAAGQLAMYLGNSRYTMFPVTMQTERPDRVAQFLERGKIAILLDGSRFAITLPVRFFDFMHAMDDDYEPYWMGRVIILFRYIGMLLSMTLPALYIAVTSYNPEFFRVQLAFSIDGSRAAVPYPAFIEVFIMLFMIEALIEASIRLPRFVGSTAATVGGLILGQAAQQAGLVSSIMIIVTSVVAISNFVIPSSSFSYSIRALKYVFVVMSIFYGMVGVIVTMFLVIVYLCHLRSFGQPYLSIYQPGENR